LPCFTSIFSIFEVFAAAGVRMGDSTSIIGCDVNVLDCRGSGGSGGGVDDVKDCLSMGDVDGVGRRGRGGGGGGGGVDDVKDCLSISMGTVGVMGRGGGGGGVDEEDCCMKLMGASLSIIGVWGRLDWALDWLCWKRLCWLCCVLCCESIITSSSSYSSPPSS
jgi:hypothetical protein